MREWEQCHRRVEAVRLARARLEADNAPGGANA
jgi:hypothetical protein